MKFRRPDLPIKEANPRLYGTKRLGTCEEGTVGLAVPYRFFTLAQLSFVPWYIYWKSDVFRLMWFMGQNVQCYPKCALSGWRFHPSNFEGESEWLNVQRKEAQWVKIRWRASKGADMSAMMSWVEYHVFRRIIEPTLKRSLIPLDDISDAYREVRNDPWMIERLLRKMKRKADRRLALPKMRHDYKENVMNYLSHIDSYKYGGFEIDGCPTDELEGKFKRFSMRVSPGLEGRELKVPGIGVVRTTA